MPKKNKYMPDTVSGIDLLNFIFSGFSGKVNYIIT